MGFDGGGSFGGGGVDFDAPVYNDYSYSGGDSDDYVGGKTSNRSKLSFSICMVGVFLFMTVFFLIFVFIDIFPNEKATFVITPKEQVLWCSQWNFVLERSTDEIEVFWANRSDIVISDEVRTFSLSRFGHLYDKSYVFRSFFLPENSTVTITKKENFTSNLIIFKGFGRLNGYYSDGYNNYEVKFLWTNDTYTFRSDEFFEYFFSLETNKATDYSVEYSVVLSVYDTDGLEAECNSSLKCKFSASKKNKRCLLLDYNVNESSDEGIALIKVKGVDHIETNKIIIICIFGFLALVCLIVVFAFMIMCILALVNISIERSSATEETEQPPEYDQVTKTSSTTPTSLTQSEAYSIPLMSTKK